MQIVLLYFLKKIHVFYLFYKIAILRLQNQIITTMDTIEKKRAIDTPIQSRSVSRPMPL